MRVEVLFLRFGDGILLGRFGVQRMQRFPGSKGWLLGLGLGLGLGVRLQITTSILISTIISKSYANDNAIGARDGRDKEDENGEWQMADGKWEWTGNWRGLEEVREDGGRDETEVTEQDRQDDGARRA